MELTTLFCERPWMFVTQLCIFHTTERREEYDAHQVILHWYPLSRWRPPHGFLVTRPARHGVSKALRSRYGKADPRILSCIVHRQCRNQHTCRFFGLLPWSVLRMKIPMRRLLHFPANRLDQSTNLSPQLDMPQRNGVGLHTLMFIT